MRKLLLIIFMLFSAQNIKSNDLEEYIDSIVVKDYDAKIIGPIGIFNSIVQYTNIITSNDFEVRILIDSPGGMVIGGSIIIDAINYMKNTGRIITCTAKGMVASMAHSILQECDNRLAMPDTLFMQHHSYYIENGRAVILRNEGENVIRLVRELNDIKLNYEQYLNYFIEDERFYGVYEALSINAIDDIVYNY